MTKATKIHAFLALKKYLEKHHSCSSHQHLFTFSGWDPSLAFVMGGGLLVNLLFWPQIQKFSQPVCSTEVLSPDNSHEIG